eukprot:scaffold1267_cov370-Prasinococcus_capsulatus_cf.AAC.2
MPEVSKTHLGGTMRLGARDTLLQTVDCITARLYQAEKRINERHRHRYEVNPEMVDQLEEAGLRFVGKDETGRRMEIIELPGLVRPALACGATRARTSLPAANARAWRCLQVHPYFVGVQYHPEFKSRPGKPSPWRLSVQEAEGVAEWALGGGRGSSCSSARPCHSFLHVGADGDRGQVWAGTRGPPERLRSPRRSAVCWWPRSDRCCLRGGHAHEDPAAVAGAVARTAGRSTQPASRTTGQGAQGRISWEPHLHKRLHGFFGGGDDGRLRSRGRPRAPTAASRAVLAPWALPKAGTQPRKAKRHGPFAPAPGVRSPVLAYPEAGHPRLSMECSMVAGCGRPTEQRQHEGAARLCNSLWPLQLAQPLCEQGRLSASAEPRWAVGNRREAHEETTRRRHYGGPAFAKEELHARQVRERFAGHLHTKDRKAARGRNIVGKGEEGRKEEAVRPRAQRQGSRAAAAAAAATAREGVCAGTPHQVEERELQERGESHAQQGKHAVLARANVTFEHTEEVEQVDADYGLPLHAVAAQLRVHPVRFLGAVLVRRQRGGAGAGSIPVSARRAAGTRQVARI